MSSTAKNKLTEPAEHPRTEQAQSVAEGSIGVKPTDATDPKVDEAKQRTIAEATERKLAALAEKKLATERKLQALAEKQLAAEKKLALAAEKKQAPVPLTEVPTPLAEVPTPLAEVPTPLAEVPTPAPAHSTTKAQAEQARRARGRRLARRLALFVLGPTAAAGVYYGWLATPQFESYSVFSVQSSELRPTFGMEGLLASMASGSGSDALAVRDYALSRDMLKLLDKHTAFIKHYQDSRNDWLSRLSSDATFEDAYEYFGSKVYADYDQTSSSITLRVRAFSSEKAHDIAQSVLSSSEEMVNKLSERQRRDRTRYAEAELKLAEERLVKARAKMVELQQKHGDFNPLQTAGAALQIRTGLESELAMARSELMQLRSYMNEDAPQVRAANEKIKSISALIAGESRRLVDPEKSKGLNTSLADFEAGMTEKEFAEKAYASALAAVELARADADRQHRYLAIIAAPSKPDESTFPHRARSVLAAFVLSFLLLGVVSLIGAAVREHARL